MGRIKNLDEIKAMVRERTGKRNTFRLAKREDVESVLASLTSKDPELWAKEWSRVAIPYEEQAAKLEKAGKYFEPPLERVEVLFGDKKIPIYVRIPRDGQKHSIVINFGGIDSFKAESYEYDEGLNRAGMASCSVDMPGVGESPVKASPTADSVF